MRNYKTLFLSEKGKIFDTKSSNWCLHAALNYNQSLIPGLLEIERKIEELYRPETRD